MLALIFFFINPVRTKDDGLVLSLLFYSEKVAAKVSRSFKRPLDFAESAVFSGVQFFGSGARNYEI